MVLYILWNELAYGVKMHQCERNSRNMSTGETEEKNEIFLCGRGAERKKLSRLGMIILAKSLDREVQNSKGHSRVRFNNEFRQKIYHKNHTKKHLLWLKQPLCQVGHCRKI